MLLEINSLKLVLLGWRSKYYQGCAPSRGSMREYVPLHFLVSRVHMHSLAGGLFLHIQSQHSIFKSLSDSDLLLPLLHLLTILIALPPSYKDTSKYNLSIWNFMVHVLLKPGLESFEHYFTSMWDECNLLVYDMNISNY